VLNPKRLRSDGQKINVGDAVERAYARSDAFEKRRKMM